MVLFLVRWHYFWKWNKILSGRVVGWSRSQSHRIFNLSWFYFTSLSFFMNFSVKFLKIFPPPPFLLLNVIKNTFHRFLKAITLQVTSRKGHDDITGIRFFSLQVNWTIVNSQVNIILLRLFPFLSEWLTISRYALLE